MMNEYACELCHQAGGPLLWEDERCRVILVEGEEGRNWPGFCRVIWREHVAEMTDLAASDRQHLMNVVWAVERMQRRLLNPDKINLASLGNAVPHLHWHVIPRWHDDPCFPKSIWVSPQRDGKLATLPPILSLQQGIIAALLEKK